MNKLTSVTLTAAMIVIIFVFVLLFKIYQHDIQTINACVSNEATCQIASK